MAKSVTCLQDIGSCLWWASYISTVCLSFNATQISNRRKLFGNLQHYFLDSKSNRSCQVCQYSCQGWWSGWRYTSFHMAYVYMLTDEVLIFKKFLIVSSTEHSSQTIYSCRCWYFCLTSTTNVLHSSHQHTLFLFKFCFSCDMLLNLLAECGIFVFSILRLVDCF